MLLGRPALLCAAVVLSGAVATASHAQTSTDTAAVFAEALLSTATGVDCRPYLVAASLRSGAALQASVRTSYGATSFPTDGGSFVLLATGDPDAPAEIDDLDIGQGFCTDDQAILELTFDFSGSDVAALAFHYDFLTYEFPEFVGSLFSDYALVSLDGAPISFAPVCTAQTQTGSCTVNADDTEGNPTTTNSRFLELCSDIGCDDTNAAPGWEALFTNTPGDDAGRTGLLTACAPLDCSANTSGTYTLSFVVSDASDGTFASAAVFDDLRCLGTRACAAPVVSKCGDGVLGPAEGCDDGNRVSGDGCSATCAAEGEICPPTVPCEQVLDFEGLAPGHVLGEEYASLGAGPIVVSGSNPNLPGISTAIVFDSACPNGCSGNDDDLGTPNADFGGPGVGVGGSAGAEHPNDRPLGNLAIVAENMIDSDSDGNVDDPDDQGETDVALVFDFGALGTVTVHELTLIDVDGPEADASIDFLAPDGSLIASHSLGRTGNNGSADVMIPSAPSASAVRIHLHGSSAVDEIRFSIDSCVDLCGLACGDADGTGDVSATDALQVLGFAVGARAHCPMQLCDTDANGSVTASDAMRVLMRAVGVQLAMICGG